uniref:Uncharacterized protein n=1 Tax=Arundo donax TaxID=35708 RepID=A0A0A9EF53_ARUDO
MPSVVTAEPAPISGLTGGGEGALLAAISAMYEHLGSISCKVGN